ncbi:uncharacterized protein LOC107040730 isoform X2 [Diachasma alloeum]|uniref:uncharacterized protein LOC107040730 isoform X2 n=1 Tax=Diachasma alloeum TaxID=454923 RepID=UPI000738303A|nr:uncharacterized protein LOC107040730 isoform X2 [Diachasma alloeum]
MEKWRTRGRCPLKADVDFPKNHNRNARPASPERKKGRKWSFGNFLRRKSKDSRITDTSTQTPPSVATAIPCPQETQKNSVIALSSGSQDSADVREVARPPSPPTPEPPGKNGRKNRLKLRIQAKREKYKSASSSDEEFPSNLSLLRIHSEDSLHSSKYDSLNQKRTRGARTERYMKRILTNDQNPLKNQLKYPSDILRPSGSPVVPHAPQKSQSCTNSHSPFGSDSYLPPYPRIIDTMCHDYKYESSNNVTPPAPPPRAFKLRLYPTTMRYSLQHSDMENTRDVNSNSLDRNENPAVNPRNRSASPGQDVWSRRIEEPIVPELQPRHVLSKNARNMADERRRHSKNLEEALEELETIYNSLRLSDEDLLDRAEQRSMEEYRDKLATTAVDGSIISDTSSSTEITREMAWRDAGDADSRLKDDMAYRRMHQTERPSSVDNFGSMSRMSYLASSPCLSWRETETPRSRRGTPDLTRDDVVFRSISHSNNTLRIADPQPPFGIPLGPVTGAAESDYLHVVPQRDPHRSLYIPKREPDVVTDDLAFRSLRKDGGRRSQSPGGTNFLPKTAFAPEDEGKRAVRSLSADMYGIINKDSKQSCWYKKYVKLNRPLRVSGILEAGARHDVDINGNKPKTNCEGKVQVHIPRGSEKASNGGFEEPGICEGSKGDEEASEYRELCRELENLIKKTSEKVKMGDRGTPRSSLTEFVEWEKLLSESRASKVDGGGSGGSPEHEGLGADVPEVIGEMIDDDAGKETDLPTCEEVPHVSVSEAAHCEPGVGSVDQKSRDGSSEGGAMHEKPENTENSNAGEISGDKIQVASKDNRLNSEGIDLASMIEGRDTAL